MKKVLLNLAGLVMAGLAANVFAVQPVVSGNQLIPERQTTMKKSNKLQAGTVMFSGVLVPRTATAATVPYLENFEGITPENLIPEGWTLTDNSTTVSFPMSGGAIEGLSGHSGNYYLVSGYDASAARNAWAFTPGLELAAGTTYYVSTYAYVPGYGQALDEFKITAGTAANQASQTQVIADYTGSKAVSYPKWTKVTAEFTPTAAGTYYFAINHCTSTRDVNAVAFDDFSVTLEPGVPEARIYTPGGLWSFVQDTVYLASGQPLDFHADTENVTTYAWSVDGGATPATSSEEVYPVTFSNNGQYTISLTAGNGKVSVQDQMVCNVVKGEVGVEDVVCNVKTQDKFTSYQLGNYLYVGGLNQYYTTIGEKYVLPANVKGKISKIFMYVYAYKFSAASQAETVLVKVCNVNEKGLPGEMISGVSGKMSDIFGTQDIVNGKNGIVGFTLKDPIPVQGSFFIVLELPEITPSSSNYFGLVSTEDRPYEDCTSYCHLTTKTGEEWLPMTEVLSGGGNLSFMLLPNYIFDGPDTGVAEAEIQEELKPVFAGDVLRIHADAGTGVAVTDLSGRTVCNAAVTDGTVAVGNLPAGVYIVSVKDGNQIKNVKVVKR